MNIFINSILPPNECQHNTFYEKIQQKYSSNDENILAYTPNGCYPICEGKPSPPSKYESERKVTDMASKQYVEERIQKATEQITKKQGTIQKKINLISKKEDQIRKLGFDPAEATEFGWSSDEKQNKAGSLAGDIRFLEDDLERLHKEVKELQERLQKYETDLQVIIEKENSRDIKVILDFLENWKEEVKKFYNRQTEDWISTLKDYWKEESKFCEWFNQHFEERRNKDLLKEMKRPVEEAKEIHAGFNYLDRYMERQNGEYILNMELLQKDLDQEANRKYDFIIERTNAIVGQITDASALTIGNKGDLNGFIKGTKGTAKVQTIGAGGWNIQCFHFRTLINEVK